MKIRIQKIKLLNFKGVREQVLMFDGKNASIHGANATGKTTIFDAFTWLLFDKDSNDRKDFNIKTLNPDGSVIERLPHEVWAVLEVDGVTVTLRKCYSEKWTKRRASAIEEFSGHETTQFVNDVPCGAREYAAKIDEICPEHIFKLITNPLYFASTKKELQRDTLLKMAGGDVTDADMATINADFADLVKQLSGKTITEYKREIAAKKKVIQKEKSQIPARIDERKRSMPVAEDWPELERELNEKKKALANIDKQLLDTRSFFDVAIESNKEITDEINQVENTIKLPQ